MPAHRLLRIFAALVLAAATATSHADDIAPLLLEPLDAAEASAAEAAATEDAADEAGTEEAEAAAADERVMDEGAATGTEAVEAPADEVAADETEAVETIADEERTDATEEAAAEATAATEPQAADPAPRDDTTESATAEPTTTKTKPAETTQTGTTPPQTTPSDEAATKTASPAAAPAKLQPPATATAAAKKAPPKKPVLVPGTGSVVKGGGDDFEDQNWQWYYNHPKSSQEQDKRVRAPTGASRDGSWFEGPKRGTPDVVKRIELPAPGLEGSTHGLLFATLNAGIPRRVTNDMQQDDLVFNLMRATTGRGISVADSPSVVVRVYLPPFEQWENRSGPSFGFRAGCYTHAVITNDDHPDEGKWGLEEYWPGMFICFQSSHDKRHKEDGAYLRVRGGRTGGEIMGPRITELGWWTLGLSFSPDGMVHYFASPGVDPLTMDDHITSQFPYGYRTEWMKTYFFNVCTRDDGRTWSTPWVIDDPKTYFVKRPQMATTPAQKR